MLNATAALALPGNTCGQALADRSSAGRFLSLCGGDPKIEMGMGSNCSSGEKTISLGDSGSVIGGHFKSDDNKIDFPDPGSATPVFFVTPD